MYQHTKERGSFLKLFTRWTFLGKEQTFYRDLLSSYNNSKLFLPPSTIIVEIVPQALNHLFLLTKYVQEDAK
jgi:hypothetical protein